MPLPDLSTLTRAEAIALAEIAQAALPQFVNAQHDARLRMRASPGSVRWLAEQEGELADARKLEASARAFHRAAHQQALDAERRECLAVRSIEAFIRATGQLVREPGRLAA